MAESSKIRSTAADSGGLFEPVAAARITIPGRYDDDDIQFTRQLIKGRCPSADLAAIEDPPAVGQCDDKNAAAETLIKRRDGLPHLRWDEATIIEVPSIVYNLRCADTRASLQLPGFKLRTQVTEDSNPRNTSSMPPNICRAEIGGNADYLFR